MATTTITGGHEEKDICLNCEFFKLARANPVFDGHCQVKLPPQFANNSLDGIRFADEHTCSLHRHLDRRR